MGLRQGPQRLRDGSALQGEGRPQEQPWPEKPLFCGKAALRPLVGRVQWVYAPKIPPASGVSRRTVFTRDVFHVES